MTDARKMMRAVDARRAGRLSDEEWWEFLEDPAFLAWLGVATAAEADAIARPLDAGE